MQLPKLSQAIPSWPPGVYPKGDHIHDATLKQSYPVNPTAEWILNQIDGKTTIGQITQTVAAEANLSIEQASASIIDLTRKLNRAFLLNLNGASFSSEVRDVGIILLTLLGWRLAANHISRRIPLSGSAVINLRRTFECVWYSVRAPLFVALVFLGLPLLSLNYSVELILLGAAFLIALVLHEIGHIWALRRVGYHWDQMFLFTRMGTVGLGRSNADDDIEVQVGMAGPGLPVVIGGLLATSAWLSGNQWPGLLSIPFLGQALSLLPMFDDNKVLARLIATRQWRISGNWKGRITVSTVLKLVWRASLSIVSVYIAFIVVSFLVSIAADLAGAASFTAKLGPIEFYQFFKEPENFRGHLGGGAFWLAVILGLTNTAVTFQMKRRTSVGGET